LARKAKRWDEKHMTKRSSKEVTKKIRKQGELTTIEIHIKGIENRLKYSHNDLTASDKTLRDYDI
jgi:structural maintenance of chromosome 1